MLSDLHTHTIFSVDGEADMEASCRAAVERGLGAVAFCEHYDILPPGMSDPGYPPHFMDDRTYYVLHEARMLEKLALCRAEFAGRLQIVYGVELGQALFDPAAAEAFTRARRFDFILGAQHANSPVSGLLRSRLFGDRPRRACFEEYLSSIVALLRTGGFTDASGPYRPACAPDARARGRHPF
jgi:HisJ family histidinol phosphate phosphatase